MEKCAFTYVLCLCNIHYLKNIPVSFHQKMARAFGGLAAPPGRFNGELVRKNDHRFCSLHSLLNASRSHISPIGMPQPGNKKSCKPRNFRLERISKVT